MYDNENSIFTPIGIAELISSSYLFNQIRTEDIVSAIGISPTTIKKLTFELLTKAIFPVITSHMSKPVTIHASHVYNGFFTMDEKMEEKYITATEELRRLVVFKDDNIYNKNYMSKIQPILKNLETSKLGIIKRLVAKELEDDKKKVIVCVNFLDSIAFIQDNFNKYDYLVLDGSVPAKKRQSIIDLFNNNKKYRLLICTPATGGVGVSLHDVKGNSPRVMFIVPTYDMIKILQAAGRIDREGKKSDTVVYIVYGLTKNKVTEKRIMDALARKSQVLKTINTSDDILPGDFPIYTEGEKISSE
jgi:superfamily II DNA/RNA helicase